MDHRGPYRCFDAETLITAFQVLLSNHFCILLAMWSPYASLIQLWDCYKKQCLKSGYVISAAVLLPTKPITLSQEEIILVTQFVLEKPMVAATQILLSPRCIHAKCSTICFRVFFFFFSFPRFHIASISFFLSEKEPKPKAVDLEKWTLITHIPHVSTVWGRERDGFALGP